MIVKNITNIKYFTDRFDAMDPPFTYRVDYHPTAPQTEFNTNPTFVGSFKNCLAHSLPFLITEDQHLITNHVWILLDKVKNKPHKTHGLWQSWGATIDVNLPNVSKSFTDEDVYVWLPIDEQSAENPWHIWIDVISKFRLLSKKYKKPLKNYVFILSNPSNYFNRVVKELSPDIKYYVMPKNAVWRFKELIVPSVSNHNDGMIVPAMVQWLRETFGTKVDNPKKKIFVSRQDALTRKLTNAEELFIALKGWEVVTLSDLSIREQMQIFSEAAEIITTHGAGLVNLLWCQMGTKVVEIGLPDQVHKKVYPVLSHCLGLNHKLILGKKIPISVDKNKPAGVKRLDDYANIEIDVKTLLDIIEQ